LKKVLAMKKQATIVFCLFIYLSSFCQTNIITKEPCTDAMAQQAKGRWIKSTDLGSHNSKETNTRLDEIHNMILNIYSQPTGVDAVWHRSAGVSYFGSKRKFYKTSDGRLTFDFSNLPHFTQYYYNAGFFRYRCEYNKTHSLVPGYPGETGTFVNVLANLKLGDMAPDDTWTINGLQVLMRKPMVTKSEGIAFFYAEPGANSGEVLVHRKGILPYLPVSRKEYLEYCIIYHTRLWDEVIKGSEQMPVRSLEEQENEKKAKLAKFEKDYAKDPKRLKSAVDYYLAGYKTDQEIRNERVEKDKKLKAEVIKKFTDELEKTTREGLLDLQAMIIVKYYTDPVFTSDSARGYVLITENPDYIRKNLPKYIPQFFIVAWRCNDWIGQKRVGEIMEARFPFEKLQAMIDK
jgi:hypothetical protein